MFLDTDYIIIDTDYIIIATQVNQAINITLSDYLFLCYWESKLALLEPFIVKGVRNCSIALNGKRKCIII